MLSVIPSLREGNPAPARILHRKRTPTAIGFTTKFLPLSKLFVLPHPPLDVLLQTKAKVEFDRPVKSLLKPFFGLILPSNRVQFFLPSQTRFLLFG